MIRVRAIPHNSTELVLSTVLVPKAKTPAACRSGDVASREGSKQMLAFLQRQPEHIEHNLDHSQEMVMACWPRNL
jgi:hypothetical protein